MQIVIGILCVGVGACIGGIIGAPFAASMIAIGAVAGGIVGGFIYAAVMGVQHVIKKKAYPAHDHTQMTKREREEEKEKGKMNRKPLSTWGGTKDWGSDDNLRVFKDIIKLFSNKPWFTAWKKHKDFEKDSEAAEYLFGKWIPKGLSFGEAQVLLMISKTFPKLTGENFLRKVRPELLYLRQIPEFILKDLALDPAGTDLRGQVEAETSNIPKFDLAHSREFNLRTLKSFRTDLKERLDTNIIGATVELYGKNRPTLYIRLQEPYSFYDPFSKKFGGLHENFASKDDFIEKLSTHLKCFKSPWRFSKPQKAGIIKFYR